MVSTVRVWLDDVRDPPDPTWLWFKDSSSLLRWLERRAEQGLSLGDEMSLDHDLGGEDTSRRVVQWMCENEKWPAEIRVHSANPVGRQWLEGTIGRYMP